MWRLGGDADRRLGAALDEMRTAPTRRSGGLEAGHRDDVVRDIGGPRGYERGEDRPVREYFAVICSECGNQAQVPFKPRMDRPVYCSDCFRQVKPD